METGGEAAEYENLLRENWWRQSWRGSGRGVLITRNLLPDQRYHREALASHHQRNGGGYGNQYYHYEGQRGSEGVSEANDTPLDQSHQQGSHWCNT